MKPRKAGKELEVHMRGYSAGFIGAELSAKLVVAKDRYGLDPRRQPLSFPIDCVGE
jgi:hypothetical protein